MYNLTLPFPLDNALSTIPRLRRRPRCASLPQTSHGREPWPCSFRPPPCPRFSPPPGATSVSRDLLRDLSRSNSLAMVTPSLQTIGAPHFFSISTDFDFGPKVTRTASASWVAPRRIFSRAAERKRTCLCAMGSPQIKEVAAGSLMTPARPRRNLSWQSAKSILAVVDHEIQFFARLSDLPSDWEHLA